MRPIRKFYVSDVVTYLILVAGLVLVLIPVGWTYLASLKLPGDITAFPPKIIFTPTLGNYAKVLIESPFFVNGLKTSAFVTLGATALSMIVGVPVGYAIARSQFAVSTVTTFLILSTRFVPIIAIIVPLVVLFQTLNLSNHTVHASYLQ